MPKVSEEHRAAVRSRLLDAAATCLRDKGFEATTTRDILAEAGLSAGAMYTYFRSKDELLLALAEREQATTFRALLASAPADGKPLDPSEFVLDLLGAVLHADLGDDVLRQMRARATHDDAVATSMHDHDTRLLEGVAPIVEAAQSEGFLADDVDPAALVELIAILYDALAERGNAGGYVTSLDRVVETAWRVLTLGAIADTSEHRSRVRQRLRSTTPDDQGPSTR